MTHTIITIYSMLIATPTPVMTVATNTTNVVTTSSVVPTEERTS